MSRWRLKNELTQESDWIGVWDVQLCDASYIANGCRLVVDERLDVTVYARDINDQLHQLGEESTQLGGTNPTVEFLDQNGYLKITGINPSASVSRQGTYWPPNTPYCLAFALYVFEELDESGNPTGEETKQCTSLSYVGDPEDAGVMAAEAANDGTVPDLNE